MLVFAVSQLQPMQLLSYAVDVLIDSTPLRYKHTYDRLVAVDFA